MGPLRCRPFRCRGGDGAIHWGDWGGFLGGRGRLGGRGGSRIEAYVSVYGNNTGARVKRWAQALPSWTQRGSLSIITIYGHSVAPSCLRSPMAGGAVLTDLLPACLPACGGWVGWMRRRHGLYLFLGMMSRGKERWGRATRGLYLTYPLYRAMAHGAIIGLWLTGARRSGGDRLTPFQRRLTPFQRRV